MSGKSDRAWAEAMGLSVDEFRERFTPWRARSKVLPNLPEPSARVTKNKPSKLKRQQVIDRDGLVCRYCAQTVVIGGGGHRMLTIDHVLPRSRGGTNALGNLVVACWGCNQEKAHLLAGEWQSPLPNTGVAAFMRA